MRQGMATCFTICYVELTVLYGPYPRTVAVTCDMSLSLTVT